jgi:two-component system, NtrC family, sensor kinase
MVADPPAENRELTADGDSPGRGGGCDAPACRRKSDAVQPLVMRSVLLRSAGLPAFVAAGFLLLALGLMLAVAARSLSRIEPLQNHLAAMQRVQGRGLAMQYLLIEGLRDEAAFSRSALAELRVEILSLAVDPALLTATARRHLRSAHALLADPTMLPRDALQAGLTLMHEALAGEAQAHDRLLALVRQQAELELHLAAAALAVIPVAVLAVLFLLRRRILRPLSDLSGLMDRLALHDFAPADIRDADPVLEPLLANYNRMVARLAELEAEHAAHRDSLQAEVRTATRDLLAHNRSLAQSEKLAAVGELAASLAHELRNPLAGIQLALENLHRDLADGNARQRLDPAIAELKRLTALLNDVLGQSRQTPEAPVPVQLSKSVAELLTLARYQISGGIVLVQDIPDDLICMLPEGRFRQALLNLALNAAQATGETGTVRVIAGRADGKLRLSVEDEGPGFPEAMVRAGVQHFRSGREGGTGLGLATVRRLALDLGGELRLENLEPRGARVTLLLPCPDHGRES